MVEESQGINIIKHAANNLEKRMSAQEKVISQIMIKVDKQRTKIHELTNENTVQNAMIEMLEEENKDLKLKVEKLERQPFQLSIENHMEFKNNNVSFIIQSGSDFEGKNGMPFF